MQFNYGYVSGRHSLASDVQRFVDFLEEHGVETVSQLKITCYPWRNGKRLQAVNAQGEIRPITFDLAPEDARHEPSEARPPREQVSVRERPDDLGNFGLATFFDHDD